MSIFKPGTFSHLKPKRTAKYTLPGVTIGTDPVVLELVHAGEGNKRFQSALLKAREETGTEKMKQWATLLARHAIVGWSGVVAEDGAPIPFSVAGAEEMLHMIIDESETAVHFILPLLSFAGDPSNFREPTATAADLGNE